MELKVEHWGQVSEEATEICLFTLNNSQGMSISMTNYGCILTSVVVPDRAGNKADVVLGYDSLKPYLEGHPFFGAIAGRFANRIRNGRYELDGQVFQLETNEAATGQHLHGGSKGFDKFVWKHKIEELPDATFIHFHRISPDGESGYGGRLSVTHSIGLDEDNQLHYRFKATTNKPTVVNLVNHSYYNLAGHNSGSVDKHELKVFSHFYTPVDEQNIPLGEIRSVKGTQFDFSHACLIGEREFDHNLILNKSQCEGEYHYCAELYEPQSGRMMTVLTTQPGVQFYNGFKLANKNWIGKQGYKYEARAGLCLETQHFPDSPNQVHFPSVRLNPGEVFEEKTIHRFGFK